MRNLQVLAESTQRLSDGSKARRPEVDWRAIAGFRNVLVHDYLGVDAAAIWKVVQADLPVLKEAVANMLAEGGPTGLLPDPRTAPTDQEVRGEVPRRGWCPSSG